MYYLLNNRTYFIKSNKLLSDYTIQKLKQKLLRKILTHYKFKIFTLKIHFSLFFSLPFLSSLSPLSFFLYRTFSFRPSHHCHLSRPPPCSSQLQKLLPKPNTVCSSQKPLWPNHLALAPLGSRPKPPSPTILAICKAISSLHRHCSRHLHLLIFSPRRKNTK